MTETPMLEVKDLVKRYQHVLALDSVSLSVRRGETLALIGPSGCGKSTLCRAMVGLEPITSGSVHVDGAPFMVASERHPDRVTFAPKGRLLQLKMGMVFQEYSLFPQMTVLKNIMLGQRKVLRRNEKDAAERARQVLAMVGLTGYEKAFPEKLSGGQKQRVAIARELAMDREIIYLDEVTSALDPELVHEVLQVIKRLALSGMTVVMVTHEMAFARSVADRVVFMDQGRIVEQGTPGQLFDRPAEARTREFLEKVL